MWGGSIFFLKPLANVNVINDLNGELINLYKIVKHHKDELLKQFDFELYSRQRFKEFISMDKSHLTDIQRAAIFMLVQHMSYRARIPAQTFNTSKCEQAVRPIEKFEEKINQATKKLRTAVIENKSWEKCIEIYDTEKTFFFCDPPYLDLTGYGVGFGVDQYELMSTLAKTMKGKIMITINDIPKIREIFDGLNFREVEIKYSIALKEHKKSRELIITNYLGASMTIEEINAIDKETINLYDSLLGILGENLNEETMIEVKRKLTALVSKNFKLSIELRKGIK